ncbi:MAG: methionyl-tRNA formyltransferase [Pseudobacter sp.]|uniref:methionyl-tRNA formyltransferase n=1 Tax=Pseudobacter sp. TaxID=2045420 RepID=UPI003F7D341F
MTLRIAIICKDRICLPAVNWLTGSGFTVAVGMPADGHEIRQVVALQCMRLSIPFQVFQKENLEADMKEWILKYRPDIVLVKTFPWLIPSGILGLPPKGFINFHYAPLPEFRGPNPLFWMIRHQIRDGGVSVHQMDECFDSGPLLLQQPVSVNPDFTYGMLVSQLAFVGLQLCQALLQAMVNGIDLPPVTQEGQLKWYRRPLATDLIIHWEQMTAPEIRALCLACNPWNKGAATSWKGWLFGLTDVSLLIDHHNTHVQAPLPGTVLHADAQNGLLVSCLHNQLLKVNVIYSEEGFFPGHQLASFGIKPGDRLGNYTSMSPVSSPPETYSTSTLYQS